MVQYVLVEPKTGGALQLSSERPAMSFNCSEKQYLYTHVRIVPDYQTNPTGFRSFSAIIWLKE